MMTAEIARRTFSYDQLTGLLTWRIGGKGRTIGGIAGTINGRYRRVFVDRKGYQVHRLVWLIVYGKWPTNVIDHINGDGLDNRIENLRDVSHRENICNQECHRNGKLPGATFHKCTSKWQAKIRIGKKYVWLGLHDTKEAAYAAYCSAADNLKETRKQ